MASEMPVLPEVGSRMVEPGRSRPSFSAAATIASPTRSLTEPVGFWSSSFAHSRTWGDGESRGSPTSGVPPTVSTSESKRMSAAGDCGQDHHGLAVGHRRRQATGEAHVLVVDVDVDEAPEVTVLHQPLLDAGVVGLQILDHRAERLALRRDGLLAVGERPQDRRDPNLDCHLYCSRGCCACRGAASVVSVVTGVSSARDASAAPYAVTTRTSSSVTSFSTILNERNSTGPSSLPHS